jgi:hypothetical protein
METLDNKRARLRRELRRAYSHWMQAGEGHGAPPAAASPIGTWGCTQQTGASWFDYLSAKQRLVAAYAEQAPAP